MFGKKATITVPLEASRIYQYLRTRYDSDIYRYASLETKGYVPKIERTEEVENRRLSFRVPGRDPILRIFISGWRWSYDLEPLSESETRVTVSYKWSVFMALLGMGTVGHQAANEVVETAMALDALSR